jgi:hypothetical protein
MIDESKDLKRRFRPRDHIKTWCERARILQCYLLDPSVTVTWWHAVEDKAVESADAIAESMMPKIATVSEKPAYNPAALLGSFNRR